MIGSHLGLATPGWTVLHAMSPLDELPSQPENPVLRIVMDGPLGDADAKRLAAHARLHERVTLCVSDIGYVRNPFGLGFLRHFPFLHRFDLYSFWFDRLDDLSYLPDDLAELDLGKTEKRIPLGQLRRFRKLKALHLDSQKKGIEVLGEMTGLETLTLRSITLPDLELLLPLTRLQSLAIKLGGTRELGLLPNVGKLRYLELWLIKGLADIRAVAGVTTLQYLYLQALKNVTSLPSFAPLTKLRRVQLEQMTGLKGLRAVADAPALEELEVSSGKQFTASDFAPFVGHPSLRAASIGLGSIRRNEEVDAMLALPAVEAPFQFR